MARFCALAWDCSLDKVSLDFHNFPLSPLKGGKLLQVGSESVLYCGKERGVFYVSLLLFATRGYLWTFMAILELQFGQSEFGFCAGATESCPAENRCVNLCPNLQTKMGDKSNIGDGRSRTLCRLSTKNPLSETKIQCISEEAETGGWSCFRRVNLLGKSSLGRF